MDHYAHTGSAYVVLDKVSLDVVEKYPTVEALVLSIPHLRR
jgi:hypothetical protein